jgi:hypothetical protein
LLPVKELHNLVACLARGTLAVVNLRDQLSHGPRSR